MNEEIEGTIRDFAIVIRPGKRDTLVMAITRTSVDPEIFETEEQTNTTIVELDNQVRVLQIERQTLEK